MRKSQLALDNRWKSEVDRRSALPDNLAKRARLSFRREPERITLRIADEGRGFAWRIYLELDPDRACDPNGRGIALARMLSFSSIHYEGCPAISRELENGKIKFVSRLMPMSEQRFLFICASSVRRHRIDKTR